MKNLIAGPPANSSQERSRLDELRRYGVLGTEPEQALDDLTALAAMICEAPIALITLIDEARQWFKSSFGVEFTETPLDVSICVHAIQQEGLFIVPDATQDARFAQNPVVTGKLSVRFYAGAPLVTPGGISLGTLCVVDHVPRSLTAVQQEALRVLSRQVMTHLELRRQTRELMESEDLFGKAFRLSPDGMTIARAGDYTILKGNEAFCSIWRNIPEEATKESSEKLSQWMNEEERLGLTRRLAKDGECLNYEMTLPGAEGAVKRFKTSSRIITLKGDPCILSVMHDVTSERQTENALAASELRYRRLFESAQDGILILDSETGMVVDVNPFLVSMLGFSHEQFLGKAIWELGAFRDLIANEIKFGELKKKKYVRYEHLPLETADGQKIEVEFVSNEYLVDGCKVIQCNVRDMTERIRADAHLRMLETCVARMNDIVIITEAEPISEPGPRILFVNDAFVRQTGYAREDVLGRSPRFMHGAKTSRAELDRIQAAMKHQVPVRAEVINYTKSGGELRLEIEIVPVANAVGRVTNFVAVERDVTERKRVDDRFRRLVDSNAQGVIFWKTNGELTGSNDAFLDLVGHSREDMEAGRLNWIAMTPPEYAGLDRQCLEMVAAKGACPPYEKEYLCKDGSRVPVLIGASGFEDNSEEGVCFVVDLTERKKLEQQFLRSQRMESIGTLAGGIAHDLNNVLSPIMMALEVLKGKFTDPVSQELIAVISSSAHRGADMVRQVLSFARGVEGRRMEVQVSHIVREVEKIANDTFPKNIQVRTIIPYDLWTVVGDPTQLHQVLLNLCVNARDAMPEGGAITIFGENITLDAHYAGMCLNPEAQPGPYVFLKVKDSGTGMTINVLEKIFDPFFTTKELGKGTGLGLSTSLAIVKSHGGFIRVFSEIGKGTTFEIYLPAQTSPSSEAATATAAELPRGNGELILVVDDEASVRQITLQTLEAFGYRVLVAGNGAEAVATFATHQAKICAVIMDMMMPVMDGLATIRVLRVMNPSVRVIATSGIPATGHVGHASGFGAQQFLAKPYTAVTLLKALKEVLAAGV